MQIETRTSLFYAAACYRHLNEDELAQDKLELAKTDSGMEIDKFVATQLYQNDEISSALAKTLLSIEDMLSVS